MSFKQFSQAVRAKWETMLTNNEIFQLDVEKDFLWNIYLASFPEGTNPIYIERTEHDCNCCKQFIRNIGRAVTIRGDGELDSVWNLKGLPHPYDVVARKMHDYVKISQINTIYRTVEKEFGKEVTYQMPTENGPTARVISWDHFSGKTGKVQSATPGKEMGQHLTNVGVFKRGLEELTPEAFETVLDLIKDNNLYKGAEWKERLVMFKTLQREYAKNPSSRLHILHTTVKQPCALIRNTSMGTLLIDLSEGKPLEAAVKAYEDKVSGTNYKRPKALLTPKMIQQANDTLIGLGLGEAIMRRHATIEDVSINNVLWADGTAKKLMQGNGLMDLLGSQVKAAKRPALTGGVVDIAIEEFLDKVLPEAVTMDLMFESSLIGNLMSITAPQVPDSGKLFKWDNGFAWGYKGNVTDSVIAARVKAAGGNIDAAFRVSLSWDNRDDLDLHCRTPHGENINYSTRGNNDHGRTILDVDANGLDGTRDDPVENMAWITPVDGVYKFRVNQFSRRSAADVGFTLEVADAAGLRQYSHPTNSSVEAALTITINNSVIQSIKVSPDLKEGASTIGVWGLETKQFVRVQTVMLSPNFWDGKQIGNQHYFFLLEGAKNDEPTRGIYNEFLTPELEQHRKVFEVLGDKVSIQPIDQQLSGVGFSSTKRADFVVRVKTKTSQIIYNVKV